LGSRLASINGNPAAISSGDPTKKIHLVYILSASHSGSTLLAMLLGSHPQVCTVGELKITSLGDPDRYFCSCRQPLKKCGFWRQVAGEMASRGFFFNPTRAGTDLGSEATAYTQRLLKPLHRGPLLEWLRDRALSFSSSWRLNLPMIQAVNLALIESVLTCTGKKVLVDSSKTGLRLKYLLRNPGLEVKVLRLIRDGRAVALTYKDPSGFADARDFHWRGGGSGQDREKEKLSMAAGAREWRRSMEEGAEIIKRLPTRQWREVKYEDLCARTEETLSTLYSFLGVLPAAGKQWKMSEEYHVIGNGMRFDRQAEIHLDDRWRGELGEHDLRCFETVAGRLNRQLGYRD
jgi:hypothetical protein